MLFSLFSHQHILFPVQYSVKKLVSISYQPGRWKRLFTLLLVDFMSHSCADGCLLLRQSDFSACDAGMLLSDKSICHFAVVLFLIGHLSKTESACPKTLNLKSGKELRMLSHINVSFKRRMSSKLQRSDVSKGHFFA